MDKDFDVFCFNPIKGYMPRFMKLEILNTWPDVKWYFPKLKNGHLLAVPLEEGENPLCAFFVKETSKIPDMIDIRKIFEIAEPPTISLGLIVGGLPSLPWLLTRLAVYAVCNCA